MKVFCATKALDREKLGDRVTEWVRSHPGSKILDTIVCLSSDAEFHCLSIVLLCSQ